MNEITPAWEERLVLMEQKINKIWESLAGDELHANGGLVRQVKSNTAQLKTLGEIGITKQFKINTDTIKKLDEEVEELRNEWLEFKGRVKGYAAGISVTAGLVVAIVAPLIGKLF